MEKIQQSLESRFDELYKAYLMVISEHSNLKLRYQQAIEGSIHDINQMNVLKLENEELKHKLYFYETRSDSMRETLPCTPKINNYRDQAFKDPYSMFSPLRNFPISAKESS